MPRQTPVLLFAALLFLVAADQFCILPLLPVLRDRLHLATLELCFLVTAYHAAAGVFGLLIGPLIDRRRHGRTLLLGTLGFLLAAALTYFARSFAALVVARTVAGLGAAAAGLGVTSYVATWVPRGERRQVQGRVLLGVAAGLILGPLAVGAVVTWGEWRWFYGGLVAGTFLLLPPLLRVVERVPLPAYRRRLVLVRHYLGLVGRPETAGAVAVMFLFTGALGGVMALLGLWLTGGLFAGVDAFDVAKVFTAGGIGLVVGGQVAGWVSGWLAPREIVLASSLLLLVCFAVLFCIDEWAGAVYTTFFCTALVESVRRGPLEGTLSGTVRGRDQPAYRLLKNGAGHAGLAVVVPVMGLFLVREGSIRPACLLAMVLTLAATLTYSWLVRPVATASRT